MNFVNLTFTIDASLYIKAQELAARSYVVVIESDNLSDGTLVYIASHPELRGCMAQGDTQKEAEENLADARTDYIYSLLVDGLNVPEPSAE